MDLAEKARAIAIPGVEPGLDAAATTQLSAWTFPNGCHIAEVEVERRDRRGRRSTATRWSTTSAWS